MFMCFHMLEKFFYLLFACLFREKVFSFCPLDDDAIETHIFRGQKSHLRAFGRKEATPARVMRDSLGESKLLFYINDVFSRV